MCQAKECRSLSEEADHIVNVAAGGAFWDRSNLQGLCAYHHGLKTREEAARSQRGPAGKGEGVSRSL